MLKLLTLFLILAVFAPPSTIRLRKGLRQHRTPKAWSFVRKAKDGEDVEFTFMMKKQNLEKLEQLFWEVSDPDSASYRQFRKPKEIDEITAAKKEHFDILKRWLKLSLGRNFVIVKETKDSLKVRTSVRSAKSLFQTKFEIYQHDRLKTMKTVFTGKLTLPGEIAKIVDFVRGISELWEHPKKKMNKKNIDLKKKNETEIIGGYSDVTIDPAMLRRYYNIPTNETNNAPQNYMAIAAFSDFYSHEALKEFYEKIEKRSPLPNITDFGIFCLNNPEPCDQFESDLDIQYITAIGKNVDTLFHGMPTADGWMLDFTEEVLDMERLPLVISISYGFAELLQCYVDETNCEKLGYTAEKYVEAVNVNWQKIALAGMAVLVADGDDGAVGVISEGSTPIDKNWWCPTGECDGLTQTACAQFILVSDQGDECYLPAGAPLCDWIPEDFDFDKFASDIKKNNPKCDVEFFEDSSENMHVYSTCTCDLIHYSSQVDGMTISWKEYKYDPSKLDFYADFPASSPYITSIGATQIAMDDTTGVLLELAASIKTKAIITTGGGFSTITAQPKYQTSEVTSWYISAPDKPPTEQFDVTKRAYPDVSCSGHAYLVTYAEDGSDNCPCGTGPVDGTSASAPMFAGLVSLLNGYLLENGEAPLGFLNPLLYKMYGESPDVFNDITSGDNKCTRSYCFEHGYDATKGWDPVAGLGSVDYLKMKQYLKEKVMKKQN